MDNEVLKHSTVQAVANGVTVNRFTQQVGYVTANPEHLYR